MAEFKAIRDNFGFCGTYWRKGDVIETDKAPNEHWVSISDFDKSEAAATAALTAAIDNSAAAAAQAQQMRNQQAVKKISRRK